MEIAIIEPNTTAAIGLETLICKVVPDAVVRCFPDFGSFIDDTPDMYSFYVITSQVYVLYNRFFLPRKNKVVILMYGPGNNIFPATNHIIDVFSSEEKILHSLDKILLKGNSLHAEDAEDNDLSAREIEVLVLVAKGYINKEIADRLNISMTTVITHRKNITAKLGIKSVSGLTIYAVANGYITADEV